MNCKSRLLAAICGFILGFFMTLVGFGYLYHHYGISPAPLNSVAIIMVCTAFGLSTGYLTPEFIEWIRKGDGSNHTNP